MKALAGILVALLTEPAVPVLHVATWDVPTPLDRPVVCLFQRCDDSTLEDFACSTSPPLQEVFWVSPECAVWPGCFRVEGFKVVDVDCAELNLSVVPVRMDAIFFDGFEAGTVAAWSSTS